jgi:hypothetical protein
MIIFGFLVVTLILAIIGARFGVESRVEAWVGDLARQKYPTA